MSALYIARAKEIASRSIGGEMMIMSARDSTLFSLNGTAAVIWQAADGTTSLAEMVKRQICAKFDVDATVALQDAEELVDGLAQHGILKVSAQPIVEAA